MKSLFFHIFQYIASIYKRIRRIVGSMADRFYTKFHLSKAVFYKLLYSYVTILVVTVLLSSITYRQSSKIIDENCRELKLSMLNQVKNNIDDYMTQIDEISSELIFNPNLTTMLYQNEIKGGSSDIYNVYELSKNLQQSTINSHYFKGHYYIFFKNSNRVFSYDSTYMGFDYFYNNVFSYNDMDYNTWYTNLFKGGFSRKLIPAKNVKLDGSQSSAITYLYTLPFNNSSDTSLGAIAFVIENKQIQSQLNKADIEGRGWIGILDENGQTISHDSKNNYYSSKMFPQFKNTQGFFYTRINGENMMVLYTKSAYNKWTYTAILPTNAITVEARNIQELAVVIILVTLILGISISCLMAYQNTKPIKKVVSIVRDYTGSSNDTAISDNVNELEYLEGRIDHIIQDRKTIEYDLKKNIIVLQDVFLDKLLKYGFNDETEMKTFMENAGLDIKGNIFFVLIIQANANLDSVLQKEPDSSRLKLTVKEVLLENIGRPCYVVGLEKLRFAVLITMNSINKLTIDRSLEKLKTRFKNEYHVTASFGIGKPCDKLFDVHTSFTESLQAIELCGKLGAQEQVIWYESLKNTVNGYYYPLDVEIRLINACKSGNQNEALKLLQKIYKKNFELSELTIQIQKLFFYNLSCTLMKLIQEVHISNISVNIDDIKQIQSSETVFNKIKDQFLVICQFVNGGKKSHNVWLRDNILAYIIKNYSDPNMGAELIAKTFHLSTSYFSQFFKEQIGETFSSYLENLRIREACLKMEKSNPAIEVLAGQVGYNNVYSFRRAFKKVIGVTPLVYKENRKYDTANE